MEGKTHMLSGLAVVTLGYRIITHNPLFIVSDVPQIQIKAGIIAGAALIGAIAADTDIPESTASNKMTFLGTTLFKNIINMLLVLAVAFVVVTSKSKYVMIGGLIFVGVIALAYYSMSRKILYYVKLTIQYGIVIGLIYMFFRTKDMPFLYIAITLFLYIVSTHRGISHTLILNVFASWTVYYSFNYYNQVKLYSTVAAVSYLAGALTHLYLNDLITNKGIPNPLYPLDAIISIVLKIVRGEFKFKSLKVFIKPNRITLPVTFTTGGMVEEVVSLIAIAIIIINLNLISYITNII